MTLNQTHFTKIVMRTNTKEASTAAEPKEDNNKIYSCDENRKGSGTSPTNTGNFNPTFYNPFEIKHRKRTSRGQFKILERAFIDNPKPNGKLRQRLSESLSMTPRGVQVWFQNRRAKAKQSRQQQDQEQRIKSHDSAMETLEGFQGTSFLSSTNSYSPIILLSAPNMVHSRSQSCSSSASSSSIASTLSCSSSKKVDCSLADQNNNEKGRMNSVTSMSSSCSAYSSDTDLCSAPTFSPCASDKKSQSKDNIQTRVVFDSVQQWDGTKTEEELEPTTLVSPPDSFSPKETPIISSEPLSDDYWWIGNNNYMYNQQADNLLGSAVLSTTAINNLNVKCDLFTANATTQQQQQQQNLGSAWSYIDGLQITEAPVPDRHQQHGVRTSPVVDNGIDYNNTVIDWIQTVSSEAKSGFIPNEQIMIVLDDSMDEHRRQQHQLKRRSYASTMSMLQQQLCWSATTNGQHQLLRRTFEEQEVLPRQSHEVGLYFTNENKNDNSNANVSNNNNYFSY